MSIIIIPENKSFHTYIFEVSSSDKYKQFLQYDDREHLNSIIQFINTVDPKMKTYLTGRVASNILNNNPIKGTVGSSNFNPGYSVVSIAAVGNSYRTLAEKIDSLANEDRSIVSEEAKKLFGIDVFTPHPTSPYVIEDNFPAYSFRFPWKKSHSAGFVNSNPKDIVVGIHDKLD